MLDEEWEWATPFRLEKSTAVIVAWLLSCSLRGAEFEHSASVKSQVFSVDSIAVTLRYLGALVDMDLTPFAAGLATLLTVPRKSN